MLDLGNLPYEVAAKQEGYAAQTYAQGDSSVSAGWSRTYSSNKGALSILVFVVITFSVV